MLASLFGFIYVLLGLETYSLLIGALALFVVVSALMVLTQMVNLPRAPRPARRRERPPTQRPRSALWPSLGFAGRGPCSFALADLIESDLRRLT